MGILDIFKKKPVISENDPNTYDVPIYFERYKANIQIFKNIPTLEVGEVILRGFYPSLLDTEEDMFYKISSRLDLKEFLPGAYAESKDDATKIVDNLITKFIIKRCLPFCVAEKKSKIPIGYILCHTPIATYPNSNEEIGDWTIDFWLEKKYEGSGIMSASVYNLMAYLQEMEVPRVYAFVDKHNHKSISLLEKCKFIKVSETYDKKMWRYGVKLKRESSL